MQDNPETYTEYLDEKLIAPPDLVEMVSTVTAGGNQLSIRVKGWSMGPFIRNHDIVTIAPLSRTRIRLGEIVAFINSTDEKKPRLNIHRVVQQLDHGNYLIKGDNTADDPDGVVPGDRILGRVIRIERNNRSVRLGIGLERRLIAWLSKRNMLISLVDWTRRIRGNFNRGKSQ